MNQELMKQQAAESAINYIESGMIVGVGTGSSVNYFIAALGKIKNKIEGAISSSIETTTRLKNLGIKVFDLNNHADLEIYIDGADEVNSFKQMIKGGGGALTAEKIIASAAKKFICIVDKTKEVDVLGRFPVAVEVLPMARSFVARQIVKLNGDPVYRNSFSTDNGNVILDVHNLKILNPLELEQKINNIPGVIENGIFAQRTADLVIMAYSDGVNIF